MDVLLTANQAFGHYYMATREYDNSVPSYIDYDKTNTTAILEYRGNYTFPSDPIFPSTNLPSFEDFIATDNFLSRLRSLASHDHPSDVPKSITTRMFITVSMNRILCPNSSCNGDTSQVKLASSLNSISFVTPNTNILSAYYWNLSGVYTTDFPDQPFSYYNFTREDLSINTTVSTQGTKVKMLNYNETIKIKFQGTNVLDTSETHPMHLHGYNFYVAGSGYGNFDPEIDPEGYNLVDPLHVNTIAVPTNGWVTVRFIANNPVRNGSTLKTSMREPPANLPQCKASFATWLQVLDDLDKYVPK
ncbi:Laccase-14 [Camellia lanceoleosa]|uniref:Laccase-14 n=1 Tax=Camellia lanceoleosa TaxID=1840588 RepID=A0ACC0HW76_9ERIC|nr:Laccase-14 [Camellia lanceoleosa]